MQRRLRSTRPWTFRGLTDVAYDDLIEAAAPLHWWKLDETVGDAADSGSGTPITMVHQNGVLINQTPLLATGKSVTYDGVNDRSIGNAPAFTVTTDWSIEFLFRKNTASGSPVVIMTIGSGNGLFIHFNPAGGGIVMQRAATNESVGNAVQLAQSTKYHVVIRYSGTSGSVTVNNQTNSGAFPAVAAPTTSTVFGALGTSLNAPQTLQHVASYHRVLSDAEVARRYTATGF